MNKNQVVAVEANDALAGAEVLGKAPSLDTKRWCTRCLYNDDTPSISFDEDGVCNYCKIYDQMNEEYPTDDAGERVLRQLAEKIKKEGRGKPFDVIVGVSGGCDSSFLVYKAKELGLRPLAVHFDNTWNSKIAVENIYNVLKTLDVELFTYVVDNEEYDDIYRAFMLAGVPDIEAPTDIGLATTLYMAAEKFGIKYMFEGHSFRTEGISPLGWLYMDGKYIQSVVKAYGNYNSHKLKTYPNLWLRSQLKWMLFTRIKKIRPLYYIDYQKKETKKFLSCELGWQWYGGHHLENRFTAFYHTYFLPKRFGIDQRANGYSALVRSGQITREEGMALLRQPLSYDPELVEMVKKRLGFSDIEFERIMTQPFKSFRDFKTYKRTFEHMRPFLWLMYKRDLVPKSFFIKYTSRANI